MISCDYQYSDEFPCPAEFLDGLYKITTKGDRGINHSIACGRHIHLFINPVKGASVHLITKDQESNAKTNTLSDGYSSRFSSLTSNHKAHNEG